MAFWSRGNGIKFTKYFEPRELECRDGLCRDQQMNDQFLALLDEFREEYGHPVIINSAFRCARHQEVLRNNGLETAKGKSSHEMGIAADVTGVGNFDVAKFRAAAEKVFARYSIGYANRWLHLDSRVGPRRWNYK